MDIARTVSPFIKGKSNLSCQPHFLHFFRENFTCGFAVENFHEKECGGNPTSIRETITGANCDRRDAWIKNIGY